MSSLNIENMAQLRLEIRRLEALKSHQEDLIKEDIAEVKKSLSPKRLLNSFFKTFTSPGTDTPDLLKNGLSFGLNFISDRMLFGKSPGLIKYLLTQLLQNTAASALANKPDTLGEKIRSAISYIISKRKKKADHEDRDNGVFDDSEPHGV